jgi:hypothetical protein
VGRAWRKRTIGIKRGYDELTNVARDCSIEAYRNEIERAVASDLLQAIVPVGPVRLAGVRVAGFDGVRGARRDGPFARPFEQDGGAVGSATLSG